jgi:uncharacterized damage-inducible protein DinB
MTSDNEPGDDSILVKLFGHNAWANVTLLEACARLSDAQLDADAVGGYGTIRATLTHLVGAEQGYVSRVNGHLPPAPLRRGEWAGFPALQAVARWAGDELLQLARATRATSLVREPSPDDKEIYPLSSLMVQAVTHSTEHRTQIATILTQLGIEPPDMSGWKYMEVMGEIQVV